MRNLKDLAVLKTLIKLITFILIIKTKGNFFINYSKADLINI